MDLYQPCIISANQSSTNNVNQPSTSNVNQQNTSSTMQLSTNNVIQTNRKSYSSLTLQQKLEVLKLKDAGASTNYLAIRYKVDESTIRKWIREREKLEKYSSLSAESKRVRLSPVEKVNEALTIWFHREKKLNKTVSVTDVKAKAHEFFKRFGGMESFKASDGWFRTWKKRSAVQAISTTDEQLGTFMDTELVTDFKSTLLKLMEEENLTPCQIFNASETDLYYKMMPNEILVHTTEHSMPGYKKIKDRLTVMACANATGLKKIPLLIIGRFEKPRSIKNLAPHLLPVKYASHPNAMLSAKIFETWFKDDFVPYVLAFLRSRGLPEKAILLLDNIKLHLSASVLTIGGIRAVFLPTNITKLIQPMDQGVIEEIKNRYRSKLLTFIMNVQGIGQSYNEAMKGFNVKHAINFVSDAWEEVTPKTICTCWKDLLNLPVEPIDQSEIITPEYIHETSKNIPQFENITLEEVNKWIKVDTDNITDEDIVQAVQCTDNVKIEPETNDFSDAEIDPSKALEAADCLLLFFEKTEISVSDIKVLRRLRQRIEKLKENS